MSSSAWLDDGEEVAESSHLERRFTTLGYRAGRDVGEEAMLQSSFDEGFSAGSGRGTKAGTLEGIVHTLSELLTAATAEVDDDTRARLDALLERAAAQCALPPADSGCCGPPQADAPQDDCSHSATAQQVAEHAGACCCHAAPPAPSAPALAAEDELVKLLPAVLGRLGVDEPAAAAAAIAAQTTSPPLAAGSAPAPSDRSELSLS
jgi:hypothetical protein